MDLHDRNRHERSSAKATAGESTIKASKAGLAWWRSRRSNLADLSNTSSTSTSIISTSSPPQRQHRHSGREGSPSSANRLLFDDPTTKGEEGGAAGPASQQPFQTQQKPPQADGRELWTRGSSEPLSPEGDEHNNTDTAATTGAPVLLPAYNNGSTARRRRPQEDLLGSSSGKLKSLKLAPTGSANAAAAAAAAAPSPGTPVTSIGGSDASDSTWTNSLGRAKGRRLEQQQRWRSEEQGRTPSKPPRPVRPGTGAGNGVKVGANRSMAARGEKTTGTAVAQGGAGDGSSGGGSSSMNAPGFAESSAGGGSRGSADGMADTREMAADAWEGMDDEMAVRFNAAAERNVVYDILAVDRGCGFCDTSIVPFPVEEGGQVEAERMREFTSGQSEFLARRWVGGWVGDLGDLGFGCVAPFFKVLVV